MKISFYGAAREVTGSCHFIEACGKKLLIDCGMQQGQDEKENQNFPFLPGEIDYVLITHAHIDHSGRLPLLVKQGFHGKIFATKATCALLSIMLRDSAHIQEMDAEWENRKGKRAGEAPIEPLYTIEDAVKVEELFVACRYEEDFDVDAGLRARFIDAGHLLGSSYIKLWITENGIAKKIVFSGDIGNTDQPILRDPQCVNDADYVVMESTYGDRNHDESGEYIEELAAIIDSTMKNGGNVVIPSFAVGRTQELLYFIREMKERGLVKSRPNFKVYVDSPLAQEANEVYERYFSTYADDETMAVIKKGEKPIEFNGLQITRTSEESKMLNEDREPKVIISASGMCDAGRIRHHLKHNLWRPECAVVFVGYQANGTLGRLLLEGAKEVKLFGERIAVSCSIHNFRGLSAHADRQGLLNWIGCFKPATTKVFVVHGEDTVSQQFAGDLEKLGYIAAAPKYQAVYDLAAAAWLNNGIDLEEAKQETHEKAGQAPAFARLMDAIRRLTETASKNKGAASKDLARFADQIEAITGKWSR